MEIMVAITPILLKKFAGQVEKYGRESGKQHGIERGEGAGVSSIDG
jgi:hypothetical protein